MRKGTVCHVLDIKREGNQTVVLTAEGHVLAVTGGEVLTPGMEFELGPVCGDWCFIELANSRLRSRILRAAGTDTAHAQDTL